MRVDKRFVQFERIAAPLDDLINVLAERIAVLHGEILVDAAGNA